MLADFITSRLLGSPIELYQFSYGPRPQDAHRYTDWETAIVYAGETYSPLPIKRGETSNAGTLDKTVLDITMPHLAKVAQMFRVHPPGGTIGLTIFQGQSRDPDAQFVAFWVGRVISVGFEGIEAKVSCEPISTSFRRTGLRRNYQYMCPHVLYGPQCKASKVAATTVATVGTVTGRQVTLVSAVVSPELYLGGMLQWVTPNGLTEARTILGASIVGGNTSFRLTGLAVGLSPGQSVDVIKGCGHTITACQTTHDNANNFGGHPWIPMKNPIGNVSPYR